MGNREQPRKKLIYNLKVANRHTGLSMGYLADINAHGMMLLSSKPAESEGEVPLRIFLPENVTGERFLDVSGEVRWCKALGKDVYHLGVRLTGVTKYVKEQVSRLIERFYQVDQEGLKMSDPDRRNMDNAEIP